MKQAKTLAKRNNAHIGLCAVLCILLLTVAGIFFGTSMGTQTSAKANGDPIHQFSAQKEAVGMSERNELSFHAWKNSLEGNILTFDYELKINYKVSKYQLKNNGVFLPAVVFYSDSERYFAVDAKYNRDLTKYEMFLYFGEKLSEATQKYMFEVPAVREGVDLTAGEDSFPCSDYIVYSFSNDAFELAMEGYESGIRRTIFRFDRSSTEYAAFVRCLSGTELCVIGLSSTAAGGNNVIQGANMYESLSLEMRLPVGLPEEPTKEGHHFAGWYYDAALTQPYDGAPIYEDTQLYAKFEINTYTVTYDTDRGTPVSPTTVDWNTAAPMPKPTRTGYNFVGWFKADGTQYNGEAVTEDMTLTAKWDIKIFTVTFYVDGKEYTTVQVPYGSSLVKAMDKAKVASYGVKDAAGTRISKQSAITEDTNVLIHELTGWEKYGDFVARNHWYTWLMVGLGSVLLIVVIFGIVELVKKGK